MVIILLPRRLHQLCAAAAAAADLELAHSHGAPGARRHSELRAVRRVLVSIQEPPDECHRASQKCE